MTLRSSQILNLAIPVATLVTWETLGRLDILPEAKGTTFRVTVRGNQHDTSEQAEAPSGITNGENAA